MVIGSTGNSCCGFSIFRTHKSVIVSKATTDASYSAPLLVIITYFAFLSEMTCLLVRITPDFSIKNPLPHQT